jgi:Ca2+-binding RTX toxin-like protein
MANVHGTNSSETINVFDGVTNGDDIIYGYGGNDSIYGLGGDDYIVGGTGADALHGGTGSDTASYFTSTGGIVASLAAGEGAGGDAEGDTYVGIENLVGTAHDDALVGDDGDNSLSGLDGDDLLYGLDGDDALWAGWGNDTLKGGGGADALKGSVGIDTASYYESPEGVTVLLNANAGAGGDAEGDTFEDIENLTGSVYADTLWGDDGANQLMGMDGNDVLKGFGGADSLQGGNGNDTLDGMDGGDVIAGGMGLDTMTGGDGADLFVWNSIAEVGSTLDANSDTVTDFNPLIGDLLALNPIDADGNGGNGDTAFTFIGDASNPFTAAGQVSWLIGGPGSDTYILLNTDGDAAADGVIRVLGAHTVDASWFVL